MRRGPWPEHNMPKWLPFPAGFRLRVRQVIPTKMKELHGEYYDAYFNEADETIYVNRNLKNPRKWYVLAHEYGEYYDAYFNESDESIYVNRNLKNSRKWYVLAHEYGAAIEYWSRWLVKKGIAKA